MSGKYRKYSFLDEFKESSKFVGSFEITVSLNGKQLQAMVRPQGENIFTVVLNNVFLAHLVKDKEGWKDYFGERKDLYQVLGKLIEEHSALPK